MSLAPGESHLVWDKGWNGWPFVAEADCPEGSLDRFVVVGITRAGVDLSQMALDYALQEVIRSRASGSLPDMPDLWTAVMYPLRIGPRNG